MTDLLDALSDRAERTRPDPDVESMIGDAVTRGHHLVRRRRAATAGAGGVLALGVVSVVLVAVLVPSGSGGENDIQPLSPPEPTTSTSATSASATATTPLVAAPPAPKKAPVSLGLIPAGWVFAGYADDVTEYRAATDRKPSSVDSFEGKIVAGPADPGRAITKSEFPLTAGKYAASYDEGAGSPHVSLYVKGPITVDIQIPTTAKLSKADILRLAGSIQIRDLSHPALG